MTDIIICSASLLYCTQRDAFKIDSHGLSRKTQDSQDLAQTVQVVQQSQHSTTTTTKSQKVGYAYAYAPDS